MHATKVRVRFSELDPYGHVNHVVYLAYLEQGRVDLLDAAGWGLDRMREHERGVVVLAAEITFHAPARYGDELTVRTEVEQLRPASSWWRQAVLRGDDLIATARVRGASVDLAGRPAKPPPGLLDVLREHLVAE